MPLGYISERLIKEIEGLKPFGPGFERPKFADRGLRLKGMRVLGKMKNALKLELADEKNRLYEGIMFGDAVTLQKELSGAGSIDIIYTPKINEYMGKRSIQIEIEEYRISRC